MSSSTMRLSTRVIKFKKDVPGSQMFDVKWNNLSSGVIINHDLPACFEIFSGTSLDQELCLVRVSYDPTKAPAKFDGYRMKMTFSDETNRIPTLTVKVKMVDNSDSEEHDQSVTHVFSESSAKEESVECQVCLAPFSDHIEGNIPRILPACGHTICHSCAVNIQAMTFNQLVIACPFDRIVTKSKAVNLPRNFTIIELICERAEKEKRNEKIKDVKICENPINPCYENRKHESTRYCRTCEVDFCESCFLLVHSPKILSNHEFEPVPRQIFQIPQCLIHEDNIITYLCKDMKCNSVPFCCNTCKESFHENHFTVPIITIAEQYERDLRDLLKTLNSTKGELNKALGETKRNLESINKSVSGYQKMMVAIKKHFEQKTEEAYKKLDGLLDAKTDGLMKDEKKINFFKKERSFVEDPMVPCYENPKHESTKYCQACEVDFCDSCFFSVHSSKILSNHQSVPISEKPIRRQNCPNHPNSIADHFCDDVNCKTTSPFCCETCRLQLHKDHSVILTEVIAEKMERELTDLLKALDLFAIQAIQKGGTLDKTKICIQNIENLDAECQNMLTAIEEHFERKKKEASQKLTNFMNSKFIYMENKEAIENRLELIKKTKKDIEKVLRRKEILFADETIDFEEIYYSLNRVKKVDLVPLPMPTFEELINPESSSSTPFPAPPADSPAPPPTRTLRDLFSFSKFRFF
ncbi:unnamed protein product [Caenorhabditis brenneri]